MAESCAAIDYRNHPGMPLILLAYFGRIEERAINVYLRSGVGSLLQPKRTVSEFVHQDLHNDPDEFRDYVIEEFWKWIALRVSTDGDREWARSAIAYLEGDPTDA